MFKKRWTVVLCCLLNGGCHFWSTYTTPPIAIPEKWPNQSHFKQTKSVNLAYLFWWKQFKSAELNAFMQKALSYNADIQLAMANIEFAQSQLNQIKLSWVPNLGVLGGYSQFPILGNPGSLIIATPLYVVNIFQLYKQQKSAQAIYEASIYAKDCAKLVILAQVAISFFTLLEQNEALRLYNQLLSDYRVYFQMEQSQYRLGLIPQDKINQISSKIKQIKSEIDITQHNVIVSKNVLHYLFNENPGDIKITTVFSNFNTNGIIPANLPADVLNNRPDIRKAEALLKAAHADIHVAADNFLPTVTLGAYLGSGSNTGSINLSEAYLTMPILNLSIFAQIAASKARYKALLIQYRDTIRQALRDVSNDLSAYAAYSQQLQKMLSAELDEKQYCHLAELRYQHGLENNIKVIQCKIKVDELELVINHHKLEKMIALTTLYQDLAGGYAESEVKIHKYR